MTGVVPPTSAALLPRWPLATRPDRPHVTVARCRRGAGARGVHLHRADLAPGERDGRVTTPARTLVDCSRSLPFADPLAVADSALRDGFGGNLRRLRIAIEADSLAWHGGRDQLASDCRRCTGLVVHGWLVLRFSWEDEMFHRADVRRVVRRRGARDAPGA
ncbi:hypothetical protein QWY28_05680 [Nocardioides sp. SOB77]|uniref:DUF559 domain-containing protein n=1 Tax=Nocardioides oceani TaxID=3058369 RepID=A0ABT8FCV5_9ACTN|nr:hypothetical protein [Nocardioides oceani]MDN4172424.1 hypothetical protein [Nocardioides oceani]